MDLSRFATRRCTCPTRTPKFGPEDNVILFPFTLALSARTAAQNRPVGTVKVHHRTEIIKMTRIARLLRPQKTDDIVGFFQDWRRDLAGFLRASRQFAVNLGRIVHQALHLI